MSLHIDHITLPFHRFGTGAKHLLCFHGVGQDGYTCFLPFEQYLGDVYTIYAFDLPFHGQNAGSRELIHSEYISKKQWKLLLQTFLTNHDIQQFDIAGFSIGGRFALATIESFSAQIEKAYLIAPDGIYEHPVYAVASRFAPARFTYRSLMKQPTTLQKLLNWIGKLNIFPSKLITFSKNMISTPEKRTVIYNSWIGFRNLKFDIPGLYRTHIAGKIEVYLFVGSNDQLLTSEQVKKLSHLLPQKNFIVLPCGHSKIVEQAGKFLMQEISNG